MTNQNQKTQADDGKLIAMGGSLSCIPRRKRVRRGKLWGFLAGLAALVAGNSAIGQVPNFPPDGYSTLLFDPSDAKHVFRIGGMPWICQGDTFCKPIRIDGVADKDLPVALIASVGYVGQRYFLSYKQVNFEKGKAFTLTCQQDRCAKLDATTGPATGLGVFQVKQGDQATPRTAFLRSDEGRNGRSQILWCAESGCAELPFTRDADLHLAYMGSGRGDGRTVAWLRDQPGSVFSCAQAEEGISDQLNCEKSQIVLRDFPAVAAQVAAPTLPLTPPPPSTTGDADRRALAAAIDQAITAGDFTYADWLLADANRRYARNAAWPPLQQRLAKARADRDGQFRLAESRRLIDEARRFAHVGDFANAEVMLQEADRLTPGFTEIAQARRDIASMRSERGQRYSQRYQYYAAIDQAFTAEQYWEAERLLAEYAQRYQQDQEYRARSARLAELRAASAWQARINQARANIATARQAMSRGDFFEAERQLALADRAAPGFPEIGQARAELSRRRIATERQQDEIRLILAAIDAALQRRQFDNADRAIEDGRNRYATYPGWTDVQRRAASARQGDDRQGIEARAKYARALELVTAARRSTAQGDFAAAEKTLNEANALSANMPEVAIGRAELERAKADRARQEAEIKTIVASTDAALARRQFADAERLIADGSKRYPTYAGWADLSRRLADARRAAPGQTGNAPMPAQPPAGSPPPSSAVPPVTVPPVAAPPAATPPAAVPPVAAPPAATPPATVPPVVAVPPAPPAAPPAAIPPAVNPQLALHVATAREAIKRGDLRAAEKAVSDAEKIDAKAQSVVEVRSQLTVLQHVTAARDAIKRSNVGAAEKAVVEAEKIDAKAPSVIEVRSQLTVLQHVVAARQAIRRNDFAAAEKAIAEAEKIDAKAESVIEVRAELVAAQDKAKKKGPPANRN